MQHTAPKSFTGPSASLKRGGSVRRVVAGGGGIALALALAVTAHTPAAAAPEDLCATLSTPVYQVVNPSTEKSLLTSFTSEVSSAAAYGFTDNRGHYLTGSRSATTGLVPVKRLYNARTYDFAWASSDADITALVDSGYAVQQTDFHTPVAALTCTVPVKRMVKGAVTRMATPSDAANLAAAGWADKGVAFQSKTPQAVPSFDPDADGRFSMAIYPDTQLEVMNGTDKRLSNRNAYVAAQRTARDIRYVLHVGDVVCWDTATDAAPNDHRQYDWASREMRTLEDAGIPWATAIGNHDTYAVGPTGGSARPGVNTSAAVRDTRTFNSYFSTARFGNISGAFEAGKVDNAFRLFTAGGKKWMVLNLELWPRAAAVTWAKGVVAAHPDHNVIVLTHSYLTGSGTIEQSNGGYGATSPQYVYDNLIKQYPNIKLVFSGHVNTSAVRSDTGVAGNKIVSVLTAFHSATSNEVRFVEIDTTKGTLRTDIYAPWTQAALPTYDASVSGMNWR